MDLNQLSYKIRGACFAVHTALGPGLLESIYHQALLEELAFRQLNCISELPISVSYRGKELGLGFRIDILVENKIAVELKSVKSLKDVHKKQLLSYLKLAAMPIGLLVNFNSSRLDSKNLIRIINSSCSTQPL